MSDHPGRVACLMRASLPNLPEREKEYLLTLAVPHIPREVVEAALQDASEYLANRDGYTSSMILEGLVEEELRLASE